VGRVWPRHGHRARPLNSVVMRRHSALGALLLCMNIGAWAKCPYRPCYAVTFDTLQCTAENEVNDTFPGAHLRIKPSKIREVACGPTYPMRPDNETSERVANTSDYFYHLYSPDPCASFRNRSVTMFLEFECCDTVPAEGACAKKVQTLKDLPPWAQ
jgi:hypothetical protein